MNIIHTPASTSSFLEQFRYILVASQLLSDHSNRSSQRFGPLPLPRSQEDQSSTNSSNVILTASPPGLLITVTIAFLFVTFIKWVLDGLTSPLTKSTLAVRAMASTLLVAITYYHCIRGRMQYLRLEVIEAASTMVSTLQDFEDVLASNTNLIQEVELLSRGYNL